MKKKILLLNLLLIAMAHASDDVSAPSSLPESIERLVISDSTTAAFLKFAGKEGRQKLAEIERNSRLYATASADAEEERVLAKETADKQRTVDQRRAEIKAALEKARGDAVSDSGAPLEKDVTLVRNFVEKKDCNDAQILAMALDSLANKSDIHHLLDFWSDGFCPACGPLPRKAFHVSHRHSGQKISLKGISSLEDLDTFVKKNLKDSRREVIAKIIHALGQEYFSKPHMRKDLETIFRYSWKH